MKLKAITVQQPWASLIVHGLKHYETRAWQTSQRGRVAIHAGAHLPDALVPLCQQEPFASALKAMGYERLHHMPRGLILGTVEIVACHRTEDMAPVGPTEAVFGDYRYGRWAWELANAQLITPVAWRGMPAFFEVELANSAP